MPRKPFKIPEATLVDQAITYLFPGWGLARTMARVREAAVRGYGQSYEGTRNSRHKKSRGEAGGSGDDHLDQMTLWELREISYELDRNEGLTISLIDQATSNVIGPWGFAHYARTSDHALNQRIEKGWATYLAEECDPAHQDHGWERIRNIYRATKIAGDHFVQFTDLDRSVPPVFRDIEAPRVLNPFEKVKVDDMDPVHGIFRNGDGEYKYLFVANKIPLANHVRWDEGKLIRGENVVSFIRKRRGSNTRCAPACTPVIKKIDNLADIETSERLALRLAAAAGIWIETDDDPTSLAAQNAALYGTTNSQGDRVETWDPMSVNYLKAGELPHMLQATRPAVEVQAYLRMVIREIGLPMGMPYELYFLDFSQATLGTLRVALSIAQRRFREEQFWFSTRLDRLYRLWMTTMVSRGRYPRRDDIFEHEWGLPGWPSPQPLQDAQAAAIGIENGFNSRTIAARNLGEEMYTVHADLLREDQQMLERAKKSGINVATDPGKQLPANSQKQKAKKKPKGVAHAA